MLILVNDWLGAWIGYILQRVQRRDSFNRTRVEVEVGWPPEVEWFFRKLWVLGSEEIM